ncbi:trigger factor [Kamptonema cortianum]|nr:trigger factor [Kamptonema cortianum]
MAFKVTIDVAPEFTLPEYKGLSVTKTSIVPTDEEINQTLENLREQQADYQDVVGRAVQAGDFVIVSYTGAIDGQAIKEIAPSAYLFAENQDMWMKVEEDFFLKGFTTQLIGATVGEKRQVTATFKEDFPQKELAGKTAVYDVEIKGLKERHLPELNDEFAAKIVPEKTLADLKDLISKDLQKQKEYRAENELKDQLVKQLLEKTQLDLPESVLEEEKRRTIYDIVQSNQQRGVTDDILEGKKDEILTNATKNATEKLKASFILLKIAEEEKIKPSEDEVASYLQIMADRYRMSMDKLVRKLRENMKLQEVYDNITIGKTLDFLAQNANVQASA